MMVKNGWLGNKLSKTVSPFLGGHTVQILAYDPVVILIIVVN